MNHIFLLTLLTTLSSCSINSTTEQKQNIESLNSEPNVKVEELFVVDNQDSLIIKSPYNTIKRIFDLYNEFQESTDSQTNLDSLQESLRLLENKEITQKTLTLVINVWMYYTVTDYNTAEYTQKVFFSHPEQSVKAIKNRIQNKKNWETNEGAPFSDLTMLLNKIEGKVQRGSTSVNIVNDSNQ